MRTKKIIAIILALLAIISVFSGCATNQITDTHYIDPNILGSIALVIQNTKNFSAMSYLGSKSLNNDVKALIGTSGSKICSIEADGKPYIGFSEHITVNTGASSAIKQQDAAKVLKGMTSAIQSATPKTAETDILTAITLGSRELAASDSTKENKVIYIISNGLQTTGTLNFCASNLLEADTESVVNQLKNNLPDLSGVTAVWLGIGDGFDTQASLSVENQKYLKDLWEAVLMKAGCKDVVFLTDTGTGNNTSDHSNWPNVSTVNQNTSSITAGNSIRLDETTLKFNPNTAELTDEAVAEKVIKDVISNIGNTTTSLLLVGSTATVGTNDGCKKLSLQRAEVVRKLLIDSGYKATISCIGIGRADCFLRVNDIIQSGQLVEENAKLNRAVFVLDASSDSAKQLVTQFS